MTQNEKNEVLITNKKARYNYEINQVVDAGIVLSGAEVKSLRAKQGSLAGSFVQILGSREAVLVGATISPYKFDGLRREDYDPQRTRKLLLRKKEIFMLAERATQKGWTLIPLEIKLRGNLIKLQIGVGRGKKNFEKREVIKRRDLEREWKREQY